MEIDTDAVVCICSHACRKKCFKDKMVEQVELPLLAANRDSPEVKVVIKVEVKVKN
jgi:hypothetical protein